MSFTFLLRNWKLIGAGLLFTSVLAILVGFWWQWSALKEEVHEHRIREVQRTEAQATQRRTALKLEQLADERREALRQQNHTSEVLRSHDLDKLLQAKPRLTVRVLNRGSRDLIGMFEACSAGNCPASKDPAPSAN